MSVSEDLESNSECDSTRKNRILLKWNNFDSFILRSLSELYTRNELTDVTLVCKDVSFASHKVVLAMWSPYFRDIFLNNPCKHPVIILQDISGEYMEILLHFIYEGGVFIEASAAKGFMEVANALKISGIEETRSQTAANISDIEDEDDDDAVLSNDLENSSVDTTNLNSKSSSSTPEDVPTAFVSDDIIISKREVNFEFQIDLRSCEELPFTSLVSENIGNSSSDVLADSQLNLPVDIDIDSEVTEFGGDCMGPQHVEATSQHMETTSQYVEAESSESSSMDSSEDETLDDFNDTASESISIVIDANKPENSIHISPKMSAADDSTTQTRISIMEAGDDDNEDEDCPVTNLDNDYGSNSKDFVPLEAIESSESILPSGTPEVKEAEPEVKLEESEASVARCTICRKNVRQNGLRIHMKRKHQESVRCPLCGIALKSMLVVKKHMNGHRRLGRRINHLNPVFRLCII